MTNEELIQLKQMYRKYKQLASQPVVIAAPLAEVVEEIPQKKQEGIEEFNKMFGFGTATWG